MEKAPRPTAEKQWQTASSQDMPASRSAMMPTAVMAQYTSHSDLAVPVMRGVILSSFIGPGVSALYSCMPPTPSSGSTATASTMMPRPPNQCRRAAPDIDGRRQLIQAREHGRAGGGQARHGLEIGVGEGQARNQQQQRNGRGGRHERPAQRHQQEAIARLQFAGMALGGRGDAEADAGRDQLRSTGSSRPCRPAAISAVTSGSAKVAPKAVRIRPRTLMTPSTRVRL